VKAGIIDRDSACHHVYNKFVVITELMGYEFCNVVIDLFVMLLPVVVNKKLSTSAV
jgi:hypothetical protein